jgi:hypothetical protein
MHQLQPAALAQLASTLAQRLQTVVAAVAPVGLQPALQPQLLVLQMLPQPPSSLPVIVGQRPVGAGMAKTVQRQGRHNLPVVVCSALEEEPRRCPSPRLGLQQAVSVALRLEVCCSGGSELDFAQLVLQDWCQTFERQPIMAYNAPSMVH